MKINLKFLFTMLLLLTIVPIFAFTQDNGSVPDVTQPGNIVLLLMPAITWLAVEIVKRVLSALGGTIAGKWILGLLVPGLSALAAYLLTLYSPDTSFFLALLLGFASTFVDQLIKQLKNPA